MKNKINLIITLGVLIFFGLACNASFTTANISSFNTGKNEKVYAVAVVSASMSKQKMTFKVFYENVKGKTKGDEVLKKDIDFEGARPVFLIFTPAEPGDYKVEAILQGEDGKEIDKKSANFTIKGGDTSKNEKTTTTTEKPKDSSDSDQKSDDKSDDN